MRQSILKKTEHIRLGIQEALRDIYIATEEWCEKFGYPTRGDNFEMNVADDREDAEELLDYIMDEREHNVGEIAEIVSFILAEECEYWYEKLLEMRGNSNMDHGVFITYIYNIIREREER